MEHVLNYRLPTYRRRMYHGIWYNTMVYSYGLVLTINSQKAPQTQPPRVSHGMIILSSLRKDTAGYREYTVFEHQGKWYSKTNFNF